MKKKLGRITLYHLPRRAGFGYRVAVHRSLAKGEKRLVHGKLSKKKVFNPAHKAGSDSQKSLSQKTFRKTALNQKDPRKRFIEN
jgi:hypothetical protein